MTDTLSSKFKPRAAATVLLLRESPLEVLMVRRRAAAVFASAWVFPGGLIDAADRSDAWLPYLSGADGLETDERANRIGALRELHEETGVFQAVGGGSSQLPFFERVRAERATLALDLVTPFSHWITPEGEAKRFDTRFYLCRALPGVEAKSDGNETVEVAWVRAQDMIARAESGDSSIMFPTHLNLHRLAETTTIEGAIAAARARKSFTVLPRIERRGGDKYVVIPAEAGYYITERKF
ncbi:MAG TPA: NUDIX hydrolase [Steroidobacteraceae bacterium]|jgi:8-oxo-dGTP pyrophosphatase MutT (NUDIX family)